MNFVTAVVLYIILLVLLLTMCWRMGISMFSAVTVSFLLAAIFLMILIPPSDLERYTNDLIDGHEHKKNNNMAVALFAIIYLATLVLVLWYVLEKAWEDRNPYAFYR